MPVGPGGRLVNWSMNLWNDYTPQHPTTRRYMDSELGTRSYSIEMTPALTPLSRRITSSKLAGANRDAAWGTSCTSGATMGRCGRPRYAV